MDSLSQAALGAAVVVATMGRRTAVWKAALWGAVAGTLPDLDALIDHGDPVSNMTFHRAETHALFWLTLAALPIGLAAARLLGAWALWPRVVLATWLALVTHPLLDAMTVYGTQLLLPFSDRPLGLGSIFIIDPLYTLPLLIGVGVVLARPGHSGLSANRWGLVLSTAYLAWSAAAQAMVRSEAESALKARGISATQVLVTPAPLNTLLWRVVAMAPDGQGPKQQYHEGFRSLLDPPKLPWRLDAFDQGQALWPQVAGGWHAERMRWFTRGFYKLQAEDGGLVLSDLRMGQEPAYVFAFRLPVTAPEAGVSGPPLPEAQGQRGDIGAMLRWLWPRLWGQDLPPPR